MCSANSHPPHRCSSTIKREGGQSKRKRGDREQGGADALRYTCPDQHTYVWRARTNESETSEGSHPGHERTSPADSIGELPYEQHDSSNSDGETSRDPGQRGPSAVGEGLFYFWKCNSDSKRIEDQDITHRRDE